MSYVKHTHNALNTMQAKSTPSTDSEVLTKFEQQDKEVIYRLISDVMGTPAQQKEVLKSLLLQNLHSFKAKRLIMQYCAEYIEVRLKKHIESDLHAQQELIRKTLTSELDKAKAELRALTMTGQAAEKQCDKKPNYHSTIEIRELIMNNIDAIYSYFRGREICASALFDHLQTYTELRPGDKIIRANGNVKWNHQVSNAIRSAEWPESPFKKSTRRGYYELEYWKSAP